MTTVAKNNIAASFLEQAPEFPGFSPLREKGKAFLAEKGLPVGKDEEYKFTPIAKKIEQKINHFSPALPLELGTELIKSQIFEGFEGDIVVFSNGKFLPELSSISSQGYSVESLSEGNPSKLGSIAKTEKDPFVALNNLFFEDGIYIHVAKNKVVEKPIFLLFFNGANEGQVISPRVLIEVEDNAEVTLLENSISLGENTFFVNAVTEVKVAQNAKANYYRVQNQGNQAISMDNFETDIHRDARFTSVLAALSGDMVRNNLNLNLLDQGCEGNMYGLYLLNGKTHVDNHTNVDHTKPHAVSNELYKGILTDSSRGVFNGKIFVRQDAQKTNAFQQNNNILLSENAIINTKPQLEIWADDVKCSHGCTTGQLDEEALFYLQARGVGKDQAKALLLYAFAGEVLEHMEEESFKNHVIGLVQERLGSNF